MKFFKFPLLVLGISTLIFLGASAQETFWLTCRTSVDFMNHGSMTVAYEDNVEYRYREKSGQLGEIDVMVLLNDSKLPGCSAYIVPIVRASGIGEVIEQHCDKDGRPTSRIKRMEDLSDPIREQFLRLRAQAIACAEQTHSR